MDDINIEKKKRLNEDIDRYDREIDILIKLIAIQHNDILFDMLNRNIRYKKIAMMRLENVDKKKNLWGDTILRLQKERDALKASLSLIYHQSIIDMIHARNGSIEIFEKLQSEYKYK